MKYDKSVFEENDRCLYRISELMLIIEKRAKEVTQIEEKKDYSPKALANSKTATPFEFYYLCREFTNERFSNRNVKENLEEDSGLGVSTVIQK